MSVDNTPIENNEKPSAGKRLSDLIITPEGVLLLVTAITVLFLATQSDVFLSVDNLLNQGRFLTEVGLIALPMTFIIVTGGIDLSVGSIFGLSAVLIGYFWQSIGLPLELSIVLAILGGGLAGFMNGFFIVRMSVPPLIMTLATLALYRGLAQGISESQRVSGFPEWFLELGSGNFLGIPAQLWILIIAIIISAIVLSRTTFGRALYAIGNNEVAARFSGLPVNRYKLIIYTFSGFMSGLAGYIFVSRVSASRSDMGNGLELDVIAAVVVGGTSIFGGTGSIIGTVIGVILIQLLKNGLTLAQVSSDASIIVIGTVLILAILVNNFIQGRKQSA